MYLICIFSPFIGSALSGLFGRFFGFRGSWLLTTIFMAFSFFCSLMIGYEVIVQGCAVSIDLGYWFSAGSVSARWGFHIDTLTVCMFFTVTLVSLCVHIYSFDYMNTDPHLPRFMSYLSLFTGFMLVLVSADNMLQMLVGWEGIHCLNGSIYSFFYFKKRNYELKQKNDL
jgi:NADH-quinone oxidoreductase subunit L